MSDVMSDECRVNYFLARQKKLIQQNNKAKIQQKDRSVTRQVKETHAKKAPLLLKLRK